MSVPRNIAVFLPNWVGDLTMATPAVRALREHLGRGGRLVGILRPTMVDVLEGTDWLDDIVLYDPRAADRRLRVWSVTKTLGKKRLDAALLLTHSLRPAVMAWMAGIPRRIGYNRNGRGLLLTDRLRPPGWAWRSIPFPTLDMYAQVVERFGCPVRDRRLQLATTPRDEQLADRVLADLGLSPHEPPVILNSTGAFGPAKLWPNESFAALARRLAHEQRVPVVVLCGPDERDTARRIAQLADWPRVVSLADQPVSLGLSKALVRRSRLMVTTDSGPRHFAAAFNVPVVTLFGPTHIAWSETYYPRAIHLQRPVPCGPCQQRICPLKHHRCMRDLTVAEVYDAAVRLLPAAGRPIGSESSHDCPVPLRRP